MSIPALNGNKELFQLASIQMPDGSQAQCIALVGADGAPISAWPLPTDAATDSRLQEILAKLTSDPATAAGVTDIVTRLGQPLAVTGTFWQLIQPVSATTLPLPDGAATQATLDQVRQLLTGTLAIGLPAGAATAAAQGTGNASLAAILSALQSQLTVAVQAFPADYPNVTLLAKLEQVRQLLSAAATETTLTGAASSLTTLLSVFQLEDEPANSGSPGMPMLAMRADSDGPTANDGDWTTPKLDEEGRLKVSTKPASIVPVVGVANSVAATVVCDVRRASNVVFHVRNVGSITLAAGTFVFEASIDSTNGTDGTWFGIQAVRSNANTIETSIALTGIAVGAGYAASWEASVNGYAWMRLRCTVAVTASASAQWTIQRGSYATEPIPAAQASATQAVSGTVTITLPGPSAYSAVTTASTNAASIKTSAGSLFELTISNPTATPLFVKLYNKASAPTVGTDVPVLTIPAPATALTPITLGALGKRFTTGIAIAATAAIAATDTAVAVAGVQIHGSYV